jgi:hypothetical protein
MTTSMTMARAALGALLALALAPAFWPSEATAHTCDAPFSTNLIAGQTIDAGDVKVCNDETTLTVTYEATFPWCLLKTDLHVATIPDPPADPDANIPQTNKGNPKPDEFAHGEEYGGCLDGPATFKIPLADVGDDGVSPGDKVAIAAHAEVEDGGRQEGAWGEGTRFVQRGNWAMYFNYTVAPPPTSCVCDSRTAPGGTTGEALLAQLCRGRALGSGGSLFACDGCSVGPVRFSPPPSAYLIDDTAPFFCTLRDPSGDQSHSISTNQAEACRTHLRVSCGRPVP